MPQIRRLFDARQNFTITLGSLASGAARQSTFVTNSLDRPGALVGIQIQPGVAPNDGTIYTVYLLRYNGDVSDDNVGLVDAAYTPRNAQILGTIRNNATTVALAAIFDTAFLGPLGPSWGIAVFNETNQALSATGHKATYQTYVPNIV